MTKTKTCGACEAVYSDQTWAHLRLVGRHEGLELRSCPCGATLAHARAPRSHDPDARRVSTWMVYEECLKAYETAWKTGVDVAHVARVTEQAREAWLSACRDCLSARTQG